MKCYLVIKKPKSSSHERTMRGRRYKAVRVQERLASTRQSTIPGSLRKWIGVFVKGFYVRVECQILTRIMLPNHWTFLNPPVSSYQPVNKYVVDYRLEQGEKWSDILRGTDSRRFVATPYYYSHGGSIWFARVRPLVLEVSLDAAPTQLGLAAT